LRRTRFLREPNAEKKMPFFFYLPLIVWTGMVAAAREEMRAVPIKTRRD
jgi:hypothetical protein